MWAADCAWLFCTSRRLIPGQVRAQLAQSEFANLFTPTEPRVAGERFHPGRAAIPRRLPNSSESEAAAPRAPQFSAAAT